MIGDREPRRVRIEAEQTDGSVLRYSLTIERGDDAVINQERDEFGRMLLTVHIEKQIARDGTLYTVEVLGPWND